MLQFYFPLDYICLFFFYFLLSIFFQDLTAVFEKANCAEDLECLGLEKLKSALMDRGLKCGGTLAERAQRLFAVRGLSSDQIDPAFFAKPTKGKGAKKNK